MKKMKKVLSALLAAVMLASAFPITGIAAATADRDKEIQNIYTKNSYNTPEEKVASMTLMLENDRYQLYVDPVSGEVACVETATGGILLSNPYDVSSCGGSDVTKKEILSQIIIQYTENGMVKYLYSFEEAAMREQITVKKIKNGVRLEYIIGREETRKLIPRWITDENFRQFILEPMEEAVTDGSMESQTYKKFVSYYTEQNADKKTTQKAKDQLLRTYPICAETPIWTFEPNATTVELNWVESQIKAFCPDYTFEQMDLDHELTGYASTDDQFPVFELALEYSLTDTGMSVRLPCNGLRYDMTVYTLESISILPYLGAGNSINATEDDALVDYNFFPDGSGALFDFAKLNTKTVTTVKGKVYGTDYAYHEISGTYQKTIRVPVYGSVASEKIYDYSYITADGERKTLSVSGTVKSPEKVLAELEAAGNTVDGEPTLRAYQRGYFAVIESGESMAEIATYHAGSVSQYNTMMNYFNPKPKDTYELSDSISVAGTNSTMTVVSDRKYTGSIKINYMLLTDRGAAEEALEKDSTFTSYEPSWFGMAEAYRDYLIKKGDLKRLDADEIREDIPLYIEVFGATETQKTILTIPVNVMTPLTTAENIAGIYDFLAENGASNVNFKMTGFANGGIYSTVPASLKWEKVIGGKSGINDLVEKANEVDAAEGDAHLGLYPDFDFAYIQKNSTFDDTNLKKDAVRTIDNRYTSYRQYSATLQSYVSFWQLAISPSRYSKFYEKLIANYAPYGLSTMSVASLGNTLNSDFDESDPYNREDSKAYTAKAFEDLQNAGFSLMTDGGNAYTWAYVDHILNFPIDSSRYVKSSATVPFVGTVLHGYVQFAGEFLNEEGDIDYAILRAVENGAGISFILSYQNTNVLKEDEYLSQYYSVRYDIWQEDIVTYYSELNELLADVQDKIIINHEFLDSERVLDADEIQAQIAEELKIAKNAENERIAKEESDRRLAVANAWSDAYNLTSDIKSLIKKMKAYNEEITSEETAAELEEKLSLLAENEKLKEALAVILLDDTVKADFEAVSVDRPTSATIATLETVADGAEAVKKTLADAKTTLEGMKLVPITVKTHYYEKIASDDAQINALVADANAILARELNGEKALSEEQLQVLCSLKELYAKAERLSSFVNGKKTATTTLNAFSNSLDSIRIYLSECAKNYNRVQNLRAEVDALIKQVSDSLEIVKTSELISAESRSMLTKRINLCLEEAKKLVPTASAEAVAAKETLQNGLIAKVLARMSLISSDADLKNLFADAIITSDAIWAKASIDDEDDGEIEETETAFTENNNQVVAVTYGSRDEVTFEKTAYKTFILNYNEYDVVVTYGDRIYTVESGGYVVVKY